MIKESRKVKLFERYIRHHKVEIVNRINGDIMFCSTTECSECCILTSCEKSDRVPFLTKEELEIFKNKYPEKFL